MRARVLEHMGAVVDFRLYTEICLGLTGWTNGYDVALKNYVKNMVDPWADPSARTGRDSPMLSGRGGLGGRSGEP